MATTGAVGSADMASAASRPHGARSPLVVGGWATALGSLGVAATSVLYALSSPATVSPQLLDRAQALAGAISGAATMHAAGLIGIFADVVMATGVLLIAIELARRGRGVAAAGGAASVLGIVIFIFVDAIVGYVLSPLAALPGASDAFEGFKRLFDVLFLSGTAASGAGTALFLTSEARAAKPLVAPTVAYAGAVVGLIAVLAALACFAGQPWGRAVGVSVALISIVFIIVGSQIARCEGRDRGRQSM
jgi:hypothetical protein